MKTLTPNFIVPGAQKSGTTSLYYLLKQHPGCFMPEDKEPQILAHPDFSRDSYLALFTPLLDQRDFRAVGEASTSYLVVEGVADRIREVLGSEMRFIFILRDPAQRALSAYLHMFKRGHEHRDWNELFVPAGSATLGVETEHAGCVAAEAAGEIVVAPYRRTYGAAGLWPFRYVYGGLYARLLEPYVALFGLARCLVIFTEEFEAAPLHEVRRVFRFLDLDDGFIPKGLDLRMNKTVVTRPQFPLRTEVISILRKGYAEENSRLEAVLGRAVPGAWRAD